jgi:hypothetical protein
MLEMQSLRKQMPSSDRYQQEGTQINFATILNIV